MPAGKGSCDTRAGLWTSERGLAPGPCRVSRTRPSARPVIARSVGARRRAGSCAHPRGLVPDAAPGLLPPPRRRAWAPAASSLTADAPVRETRASSRRSCQAPRRVLCPSARPLPGPAPGLLPPPRSRRTRPSARPVSVRVVRARARAASSLTADAPVRETRASSRRSCQARGPPLRRSFPLRRSPPRSTARPMPARRPLPLGSRPGLPVPVRCRPRAGPR